jgi:hypothetical protein
MSNFKTVAFLVPGHELFEVFPDGEVPVVDFVPLYFAACPEPCFILDGVLLSDRQVELLAEALQHRWPDLVWNRQEAVVAIRGGIPITCSHFDGGSSDDLNVMVGGLEAMLKDSDNPYDFDEEEPFEL